MCFHNECIKNYYKSVLQLAAMKTVLQYGVVVNVCLLLIIKGTKFSFYSKSQFFTDMFGTNVGVLLII